MIYIIVLNYNNWEDTIECLESIYKIENPKYRVIVCDNNSTDNSLLYIKEWAEGKFHLTPKSNDFRIKKRLYPLKEKPIKYKFISRDDDYIGDESLILIDNKENRGYAAGNNIGIKYAMNHKDCQFLWILNNDTVVDNNALMALLLEMEKNKKIGICGSKTYYYYFPDKLQCKSGYGYNKWIACPYSIKEPFNIDKLAFVNGASMFVRRSFIENIGLMNEEYFLYFEELDWAIRGKDKYVLGYSKDSIIYHKEGATTNKGLKEKSLLSDFFGVRNRIIATKNFYKYCLPTVYLGIFIVIFNRIKRKQYKRIWIFIKLMLSFGKYKY